jgi:hypothetical protein
LSPQSTDTRKNKTWAQLRLIVSNTDELGDLVLVVEVKIRVDQLRLIVSNTDEFQVGHGGREKWS